MYTNPYNQQHYYQAPSKNKDSGQQPSTLANPYKDGKIVVRGEAIMTSPPDTVTISLGAITEASSLGEAQQENSRRISTVIETLKNIGISEDDMQTVEYRMDPQYDYIDGKQTFRGYQVNHILTIILTDINMAGRITDAAVSAGANTIRNIQFSIKNFSTLYQHALISAVNDGKTKAESIASSVDVNLDATPTKIEEIIQPDIIPFRTMDLSAAEGVPIQPGTLQVKAIVEMTFTYS
ncbi:SIMPL domain-containing protein [Evansella sp. AB-rgal1]|uniref:SIMPL domain-containing protein n=1 Tax=Evansella sp. AB-rgal1 TaxID=3242696 RepID=UPI00359DE9A6